MASLGSTYVQSKNMFLLSYINMKKKTQNFNLQTLPLQKNYQNMHSVPSSNSPPSVPQIRTAVFIDVHLHLLQGYNFLVGSHLCDGSLVDSAYNVRVLYSFLGTFFLRK